MNTKEAKKKEKTRYEKPVVKSLKVEDIASNVTKGGKFALRSFVG